MQLPLVILARGGSKGIPKKNLKEIVNVSLLGRAVKTAIKSKFSPIFVYSDSEEILEESVMYGAIAVDRPDEISGDSVTSEISMQEFIKKNDPDGQEKAFALMQCTTPFMKTKYLDQAFDKMIDASGNLGADSVLTATRFSHFLGYEWFDKPETFIPVKPYREMKQDMKSQFWMENGGLYVARREVWMNGRRMGPDTKVVSMEWWESIEIDEPIDLEVCRKIECLLR